MSRFAGKTYSRVKGKESIASRAFDEIFDDGPSKPATRTAATSQKWGKTTFTSVRDSRAAASPDPKRRKVEPVSSGDPFTFESSDEGGISPKKRVNNVQSGQNAASNEKEAVSEEKSYVAPSRKLLDQKQTILPFAPAPVAAIPHQEKEEQFRPVKRFFRTHKGFLEKQQVSKPVVPAAPRLRAVVKKKTTPDKDLSEENDKKTDSQDSSTSGIFLSSSMSTKSDPDWITARSPDKPRDQSRDHIFLTPAQSSQTSSAALSDVTSIPSSINIAKRTDNCRQDEDNSPSPSPTSARDRDSLFDSLFNTSPSQTWRNAQNVKPPERHSQDSPSSLGVQTLSDHSDSPGPLTRGPPRLTNFRTVKPLLNSEAGRKTPSPPTLNVVNDVIVARKTEVTLDEGEFVFNDEDLVVIRGSSESSPAPTPHPSKVTCTPEPSQDTSCTPDPSQDTTTCTPEPSQVTGPSEAADEVRLSQSSAKSSQSDSQDSPSSQGNRRLLLKKHLTDSPKKSPAKRYNPRQWIQDGSPPEKAVSRTSSLPPSQSSQSQSTAASFDFDDQSPMPSLTRQARVAPRLGVVTNRNEEVMAVKVTREHKQLYTVVQNVKDVHECQEHGETQEFQDDIAYLLDGLNDTQTVTTRCLSTLSLANKCIEPVFRMHLRAHGTVTRIFTALKDACHNPCLAMSTSLIMFMLSRDRLSVDVDQDGMEMMINLLNADVKHRKMKSGMVKDYQRIKKRVQEVIAQLKKDGGAKNMELSEISTSNLATETLLALSSRRSGDSFKEEMRSFGGLDHIVEIVAECTDSIDDESIAELNDALVDTLKKVDRCLRVLENVTYLNSDNQTYLISYSSSSLINSLCSLLRITERIMELFPAPEPEPEPEETDNKKNEKNKSEKKAHVPPHPSHLVFQCLLSVLRVLLNITHDNVWGSQKVGQTEGLMSSALMCALHVPQYAPHSERFDLLVLSLGMIINLVEHCELNRRLLVNTETVGYYDSQDRNGQKEAIEALTQLFLQKESAAGQLEDTVMTAPANQNADKSKDPASSNPPKTGDESGEWQENDSGLLWVIGKKKKTNKNQNEDEESDDEEQHIEIIPSSLEDEENFTKALHKAGVHMEDSIVAAYVALLIGCIIKENSNLVQKVREHLPDGSFDPMVNILTKFLGFMNLTSGVAAQHSSKSIAEIIQIMDKL